MMQKKSWATALLYRRRRTLLAAAKAYRDSIARHVRSVVLGTELCFTTEIYLIMRCAEAIERR